MEFYIGNVSERAASASSGIRTPDCNEFQSELAGALDKLSQASDNTADYFCGYRGAFVVISPKIEEKLHSDPEYSEKLSQKLEELLKKQGECLKNSVVIVNKKGEITQHCFRSSARNATPPPRNSRLSPKRGRGRKRGSTRIFIFSNAYPSSAS